MSQEQENYDEPQINGADAQALRQQKAWAELEAALDTERQAREAQDELRKATLRLVDENRAAYMREPLFHALVEIVRRFDEQVRSLSDPVPYPPTPIQEKVWE